VHDVHGGDGDGDDDDDDDDDDVILYYALYNKQVTKSK
jgi:hypothetical protein